MSQESNLLGALSEIRAAAYFSRQGYHVYASIGSHGPDLCISKGSLSLTVEVKTATAKYDTNRGNLVWAFKCNNVHAADVTLVVHPHHDWFWEIPSFIIKGTGNKTVYVENRKCRLRCDALKAHLYFVNEHPTKVTPYESTTLPDPPT